MKEYKFRGFDSIGNKGWVYGDLVHNKRVDLTDRVMVGGYEVVPESVGMCTGIKDVNGVDIYQGDIVQVSYNGKDLFKSTIVWMDRWAGFYMDEEDEKSYSPIPIGFVKIVGNVFKNKSV